MEKKVKYINIATLVLMIILIVTTIVTCSHMANIDAKLQIRDRHVQMIEESKERQQQLTWKYLNMWMEEGYISGHNRHEFEKMKRER